MSKNADLESLIQEARKETAATVTAETYHKGWPTASKPALLECSDGKVYVVKGAQNGKMIVTDHVVALCGKMMDAPVGTPQQVVIPEQLIEAEPELSHMKGGRAHGTLFIEGCTEREGIAHFDRSDNRDRFARLAILYGLIMANDHQFIYENEEPHRVYSVDHGHFLPGSHRWSIDSLSKSTDATPDQRIVRACSLTEAELAEALNPLKNLDNEAIAAAVATPPEEWGITQEERLTLATYIASRRDALLSRGAEPLS